MRGAAGAVLEQHGVAGTIPSVNNWSASQRFTYKDVTTTEAHGKQINEALKGIGFCKV